MRNFSVTFTLAALSLVTVAACSSKDKKKEAQQPVAAVQTAPVPENTRQFLDQSASSHRFEVRASEIAGERTRNVNVARFASRMVTDHSQLLEETRKLSEQLGVSLSNEFTLEQQRNLDRLNDLSGEEMNRVFADIMVREHRQQLDAVNLYIQDSTIDQVRNMAERSLPMIAEHFQMSIDLRSDLQRDSMRGPASVPSDSHSGKHDRDGDSY